MIVPGRNMMVNSAARPRLAHISGSLKRLRVVVEPDPMRRLVRQELEVGEAQPEDAEDRPDLVADEEDERGGEKQPLAAFAPERGRARRRAGAEVSVALCYRLRHAPIQLAKAPAGGRLASNMLSEIRRPSRRKRRGLASARPQRGTSSKDRAARPARRSSPRVEVSPSSFRPAPRPSLSASPPSDRAPRPSGRSPRSACR